MEAVEAMETVKTGETKAAADAPVPAEWPKGKQVTAKVKLTLCGAERFFGPGVCELLEKIGETGSIQASAAQMEMSYSKAWKILNRAEEEMGVKLVRRVSGGKHGGSSVLTDAGAKAAEDFRLMEAGLSAYAAKLIAEHSRTFMPEE